jgi:hypothetical protein
MLAIESRAAKGVARTERNSRAARSVNKPAKSAPAITQLTLAAVGAHRQQQQQGALSTPLEVPPIDTLLVPSSEHGASAKVASAASHGGSEIVDCAVAKLIVRGRPGSRVFEEAEYTEELEGIIDVSDMALRAVDAPALGEELGCSCCSCCCRCSCCSCCCRCSCCS